MSKRDDQAPYWRSAIASRAHVVIDAADYYAAMRAAMLKAEQRIMLVGWDFDTRIPLTFKRRTAGDPPKRLGEFILWLAERRPELEIRILKWNFGAMKLLGRGRAILDVARWAGRKNIDFKLDSAHPFGCSHHQKIVVIDDQFAVCGGIDMTQDRWDTRAHLDDDRHRRRPNGTPYGPWHDATMLVEGEAAAALAELARDRWVVAGGEAMKPCVPSPTTAWPDHVDAEFRNVLIGIARTRAAHQEHGAVREIERLFLDQIAAAKHFIYAENQYFASRKIAEAIALRMAEPDPPEIFIVAPQTADGWLEQKAMDSARVQLLRAIGEKDHCDRFSIYCPVTSGGAPIYVHSKLMIVDDCILRVGSANMNNRSLGLDSECDLSIKAANDADAATIAALRISLLAEHIGLDAETTAKRLCRLGSMRALADSVTAGRRLVRLDLKDLSSDEQALADNAVLDPEKPEDLFEPMTSSGLFSASRILRAPRRKRKGARAEAP